MRFPLPSKDKIITDDMEKKMKKKIPPYDNTVKVKANFPHRYF